MTKEQAKQLLVEAVTSNNGCKATVLCATDLASDIRSAGHDLVALIEEAVKEGSLIEIEFVLPQSSYRTRSFLLPKGTEIHVLH